MGLQLKGDLRLSGLPQERRLASEVEPAGDLLGDRRGTRVLPGKESGRSDHGQRVDPGMRPEAPVFRRDRRLNDGGTDVIQRDRDAHPFGRVAPEDRPVCGEDGRAREREPETRGGEWSEPREGDDGEHNSEECGRDVPGPTGDKVLSAPVATAARRRRLCRINAIHRNSLSPHLPGPKRRAGLNAGLSAANCPDQRNARLQPPAARAALGLTGVGGRPLRPLHCSRARGPRRKADGVAT